MGLSESLKKQAKQEPLWEGPQSKGKNGGITQSMLARYLVCKERFRLYAIEGLRPNHGFNSRLVYGDLWHLTTEAHCRGDDWKLWLTRKCEKLKEEYRFNQEEIQRWYRSISIQFPTFLAYCNLKQQDFISQEETFRVNYVLPDGRQVYLRGKFDGITKDKNGKVWLQEYKTKSQIDKNAITDQLKFDLQTMLYLTALHCHSNPEYNYAKGVDYYVVKRPFSGGKGSIRQHKPTKKNPMGETVDEFYQRLKTDYIEKDPQDWFAAWSFYVTTKDVQDFCDTFLDPCLMELCDWYDLQTKKRSVKSGAYHYRTPYIYNALKDGNPTEYDSYLQTGNELGLTRTDTLFTELEDDAET